MKSFLHRRLARLLPLAAAALLGLGGCGEEEATFGYFSVSVRFDMASMPEEMLRKVVTCAVLVEGPREASATLPCRRGEREWEIGTFNYSTSEPRMSYKFTVVVYGLNSKELARGSSEPVGAVPNMVVPTSVLVKGIPGVLDTL